MNKEIWKDIPNYEGLYQVSNLGRIKSLQRKQYCPKTNKINIIKKERILKQHNSKGYNFVILYKNNNIKNNLVHRLVANAFIDNFKNYSYINHIDGNKSNNKVENLEWCTASENTKHAYKNGLSKAKKGKENIKSKIICQYDLKGNFIKKHYSIMDAEREKQANHSSIIRCCMNRQKSAGGYIWRYENDIVSC